MRACSGRGLGSSSGSFCPTSPGAQYTREFLLIPSATPGLLMRAEWLLPPRPQTPGAWRLQRQLASPAVSALSYVSRLLG